MVELPTGEAYGGNPVSNIVTSSIPSGVDLGYRFDQRLYIGLYGQYGFANARQSSCIGCGYTISSDAHAVKFGLNAEYDLAPVGSPRMPWLGVGFGYELLYAEHPGPGFANSERWRGFDRNQPEIPVSETVGSDDGGGGSALHGWFTLGSASRSPLFREGRRLCVTCAPEPGPHVETPYGVNRESLRARSRSWYPITR